MTNIPVFFVGTLSANGCRVDRAIVGNAVLVRGKRVFVLRLVDGVLSPQDSDWQRIPLDVAWRLYEQVGTWPDAGQVIDALLSMCAENHPQGVTNVTSDASDIGI